ncbi:MAG: HAD family hydrolase [Deltaproteobacteria bacterium]|nr:HAD family hydrolase [Deltaproteobacteria bacterium]
MSREAKKAPAVFLDRDGTLIRDVGYLYRQDQVEILPRVVESIRLLRGQGFLLVVVTNQSAVARGRLTEEDLGRIHGALNARLAQDGAHLDGIYYCPHHPTEGVGPYHVECDCRKPNTGMIVKAIADLGLDPSSSYVVGDKTSDMDLAERIGAKGVRIAREFAAGGDSSASKYPVVTDLWQAAEWIVGDFKQSSGR